MFSIIQLVRCCHKLIRVRPIVLFGGSVSGTCASIATCDMSVGDQTRTVSLRD